MDVLVAIPGKDYPPAFHPEIHRLQSTSPKASKHIRPIRMIGLPIGPRINIEEAAHPPLW